VLPKIFSALQIVTCANFLINMPSSRERAVVSSTVCSLVHRNSANAGWNRVRRSHPCVPLHAHEKHDFKSKQTNSRARRKLGDSIPGS